MAHHALAGGIRRPEGVSGPHRHLQRGDDLPPRSRPRQLRRPHDGRYPDDPRHRRAESRAPASGRQGRSPVVPGLQRAGVRFRPGLPQHPRHPRRRRVRRQRQQNLDLHGTPRRLDHAPHPHRHRRSQAPGHQLFPGGHEDAGHRGAPHHQHGRTPRVQPDHIRQRPRSRPQHRRRRKIAVGTSR